jgi:hypothetical protein
MEVAVIKDGEDKYCNHPTVILADDINALEIKIGTFLLEAIGDRDITTILEVLNAQHEPDPDSFPDTEAGEQAFEAAHEAWENYEPSEEVIAKFRETCDPSDLRELYQENVCPYRNPWHQWQIHTTIDDDAYSSVTVVA